jgi:hypothetical protein
MNLYKVVVLREDKENLERGVWADRMELRGESILFLTFDTDSMQDKMVGLYPARYTVVTSVETKEEYDKRKSSI